MVANTNLLRESKLSFKGSKNPPAHIGGLDRGELRGRLGPSVRVVRNQLVARVATAFAPFGLGPGAFSMLTLIAANDGCSQADLARETLMDKSAVVAVIDRLEAEGLVVRKRSRVDRRRHQLSLTAKGETLFGEMRAAVQIVEDPIETALSPAELTQLITLLERVRKALETNPLR